MYILNRDYHVHGRVSFENLDLTGNSRVPDYTVKRARELTI